MARTQDDHKLFGNVVGAVRRSLCTFHRRSLTSHFVSGVYRLSMIETVITSKITVDLQNLQVCCLKPKNIFYLLNSANVDVNVTVIHIKRSVIIYNLPKASLRRKLLCLKVKQTM